MTAPETHSPHEITIGVLEEGDMVFLAPLIRHWVRNDGIVMDDEVAAIIARIRGSLKGENGDCYLVARTGGGEAVGIMGVSEIHPRLAAYRSCPDARPAGLAAVFLSPRHRGKGLGRSLLEAVFEKAGEMGLDEVIWSSNPRHRKTAWIFYTGMAGEPVGTITGFFEEGIETPVWRKAL